MVAIKNLLDPYFMALGQVAHSWNHLHEELGKLFRAITRSDLESAFNSESNGVPRREPASVYDASGIRINGANPVAEVDFLVKHQA